MVDAAGGGPIDAVHLTAPGPTGIMAVLDCPRMMELPLVGSWHTEFGATPTCAPDRLELRAWADLGLSILYRQCRLCSRPVRRATSRWSVSASSRTRDRPLGRGVDTSRFDPALRRRGLVPGEIKVLYAGRLTKEKGVDLLADASSAPMRPTRGSTCCWRAAARKRRSFANGSANAPPSSAGWVATISRAPTRAPTSSCSAAEPTPSVRSSSRRGPVGFRVWRSTRGAPPRIVDRRRDRKALRCRRRHARRCDPPARRFPGVAGEARPSGSRRSPRAHLGVLAEGSSPTATTGSPSQQISRESSSSGLPRRTSEVVV